MPSLELRICKTLPVEDVATKIVSVNGGPTLQPDGRSAIPSRGLAERPRDNTFSEG